MMFFAASNIMAVIIGYLLDLAVGDPAWKYHPVRIIGLLIAKGEKIFYKNNGSFGGGVMLLLFTLAVVMFAYLSVLFICWRVSPFLYTAVSALGVWVGVSVKDMKLQATKVAFALKNNDIPLARQTLSMLVSRDTQKMDAEKIMSSVIESVGENFTDAFMSPVFYGVIAGGAGAVFFKTVSTLDSMVGYRNERYKRFGTASARMDDILGFIPARLSVIPVFLAAWLVKGYPAGAVYSFSKYRKLHASPNSGHGIAAFAGALGVTLGGPTSYGGVVYDKPYIHGGDIPLYPAKIRQAVLLYEYSAFFAVLLCILPVAAILR